MKSCCFLLLRVPYSVVLFGSLSCVLILVSRYSLLTTHYSYFLSIFVVAKDRYGKDLSGQL